MLNHLAFNEYMMDVRVSDLHSVDALYLSDLDIPFTSFSLLLPHFHICAECHKPIYELLEYKSYLNLKLKNFKGFAKVVKLHANSCSIQLMMTSLRVISVGMPVTRIKDGEKQGPP